MPLLLPLTLDLRTSDMWHHLQFMHRLLLLHTHMHAYVRMQAGNQFNQAEPGQLARQQESKQACMRLARGGEEDRTGGCDHVDRRPRRRRPRQPPDGHWPRAEPRRAAALSGAPRPEAACQSESIYLYDIYIYTHTNIYIYIYIYINAPSSGSQPLAGKLRRRPIHWFSSDLRCIVLWWLMLRHACFSGVNYDLLQSKTFVESPM